MLKTKIVIINFIILAVLGATVFAQTNDQAPQTEEETVLPRQAMVERESASSLLYMVAGIIIGVVSTGGIGYIYYHHRNSGTDHDHEELDTPVNVHPHDKLSNKHGNLQPPEIEKHGNQFM